MFNILFNKDMQLYSSLSSQLLPPYHFSLHHFPSHANAEHCAWRVCPASVSCSSSQSHCCPAPDAAGKALVFFCSCMVGYSLFVKVLVIPEWLRSLCTSALSTQVTLIRQICVIHKCFRKWYLQPWNNLLSSFNNIHKYNKDVALTKPCKTIFVSAAFTDLYFHFFKFI